MNRQGFEALADGTLLLTVLLVASTLTLTLAASPPPTLRSEAARYVQDTRIALFRTTLDGLTFLQDGRAQQLPNGTTVEEFLRIQVHLRRQSVADLDFSAANDRVVGIGNALVGPGWSFAVVGRVADDVLLVLPPVVIAVEHFASGWAYPPLDGSGPDTVLTLCLWLSPRR